MSRKENNLVQIANILKEIKEEREFHDAPKYSSRYPEGSVGIVINEGKFIVVNSDGKQNVEEAKENVNKLKESNLKYNADFYFGTLTTDEPDIIDETHNKSKLINEAYTEVSFLPKDIYSAAKIEKAEVESAIRCIIDKDLMEKNREEIIPGMDEKRKDFDKLGIDILEKNSERSFDETYSCRCVFHDISGNERVDTLLIKAFKVSNDESSKYRYDVINDESIKAQIEELENKARRDTSGNITEHYTDLTDKEREIIKSNIREGISEYYKKNNDKFFRLTRVDIKAIYCLRLQKNPIKIMLKQDEKTIASMDTYYSMLAGDFNVFSCPNCNTLSSDVDSLMGIKIHVDRDFSDIKENSINALSPIGCTDCMELCSRCNAWHFKFKSHDDVKDQGYSLISDRKFLRDFAGKNKKTENYCWCKQYLTWIYDEMSYVKKDNINYHERIIDRFLSGNCQLIFLNYLTGEVIASYDDFINYLHESILIYYKRNKDLLKKFHDLGKDAASENEKKFRVHAFVDYYIKSHGKDFGEDKMLENVIRDILDDFKKALAGAFNTSPLNIKTTSAGFLQKCECCDSSFYAKENLQNEFYYNAQKGLCHCCSAAKDEKSRLWTRLDDGVTFYKSKNKDKAIKTYNSLKGEEIYDTWLNEAHKSIIENVKNERLKEKG